MPTLAEQVAALEARLDHMRKKYEDCRADLAVAESRLASARVEAFKAGWERFAELARDCGLIPRSEPHGKGPHVTTIYGIYPDAEARKKYPAPAAPAGEQTRPAPTPEPEPQNVAWSDAGYRREVLSDATGRILGCVVQGRHEATAYGEHGVIGQYISLDLAKKAVIVALGSRPTQTAEDFADARDPQGAGTRTETKVEWRNVYEDGVSTDYETREDAALASQRKHTP